MNILILGSGGREHTLAWKIAQSAKTDRLFIAPGNAGTAMLATNVEIGVNDFESLGEFAVAHDISLVVVGPEDPLVKGIHDYFLEKPELKDIMVIGPLKAGAMLEGSKRFANDFMKKYKIPTAGYLAVSKENIKEGYDFLQNLIPPYVLKADGLAAGKGVVIVESTAQAEEELADMLNGKFGEASKTVVIEEFLNGIEASVFVLTDGNHYLIFPEAKDYKRAGEGDTGLNTGGMGAVSPVPFANASFLKKVEKRIIRRTIAGLKKEGIHYIGFLYFGLMNVKGNPYVVEYNVRMGDPEAQVVIPRIKSDLVELLAAASRGELKKHKLAIDKQTVCTVVISSGGYPGSYEKGKEIKNLDKVVKSIVFHAGTRSEKKKMLTSGGRVVAVSSYGKNMQEALDNCYESAGIIKFEKMFCRKDIGFDFM